MNTMYGNALSNLIGTPGSFSGTPGYQFARDQGLQATERANSAQRGSGNVLAALLDRGTGMANQNYMDYAKLLGGLTGQEQQYDLGQSQNANTADRNANDFSLGSWNNQNTARRDFWNYDLGREQNANLYANNQNNFQLQGGKVFGNNYGLKSGGGGFGGY